MAVAAGSMGKAAVGAPADLAGLLAPGGVEEFFARHWLKGFRLFRGWRGKFSGLLSWQDLNRLLEQHRFDPATRLRLARLGRPRPVETFAEYSCDTRDPFARVSRLLPAEVTKQLREGATLELDEADELSEPLRSLSESLERQFQTRVRLSVFASWQPIGLNLHWDEQEILVMQVAGRKHWHIYGLRTPYPLLRDTRESKVAPTTPPIWEGVLEDGDLLYLPRGWWHTAFPIDEPSLHVTAAITTSRGINLLKWFVDHLRSEEVVRRDLPRLAPADERRSYMEALRRAVLAAWSPDLLERFFEYVDAAAPSRPYVRLPWDATADTLPPGEDLQVRSIALRPYQITVGGEDGALVVEANQRRAHFSAEALPLLKALADGREMRLSELERACDGSLTPAAVRALVRELVTQGLAVAELPPGRD